MRNILPILLAFSVVLPAAAATPPTTLKQTNGWIEALAMDGPRVAYAVSSDPSLCHKLFVWNVRTGGGMLVSGLRTGTCGSDEPHGQAIREVAIAGSRLAWIRTIAGNTEADDYLYTAPVSRPKEKRLATAVRTGDSSGTLVGSWIGGLVGSGTTLEVNTWTTDATGAVTRGALRSVSSERLTTVATGAATISARSADLGRITVLRSDGSVGLYSEAGRLLRTFSPGRVKEIALRKDYLVVLTEAKALAIYNVNTGGLVRNVAGGRRRGASGRALRHGRLRHLADRARAEADHGQGRRARDGQAGDRRSGDRGAGSGVRAQHCEGNPSGR